MALNNDGSRHSKGLLAYILVVSIIAVSCLLIGVCTNVVMVDSGNEIVSELGDTFSHYEIRVKPGTFVLSGKRYDYTFVALVEFLVVLMLSWIDIHATRAEKPVCGKNNNINHSRSIIRKRRNTPRFSHGDIRRMGNGQPGSHSWCCGSKGSLWSFVCENKNFGFLS